MFCKQYKDIFLIDSRDTGIIKLVTMEPDKEDSPLSSIKLYSLQLKHTRWIPKRVRTT